jgi:alpha-L-fucosidase
MWDSRVTPWNAKAMGPKRDVVGEMARAVRKRGLKFVTSLHHQWKWGWYPTWDPRFDCSNPDFAALYGPAVPPTAWATKQADGRLDVMKPDPLPSAEFQAEWLAKVKEVVTGYEPDLLWFDNRMQTLTEETRMAMAAFYYTQAAEWGRPVVLTYKQPDLREGTATIDLERSRMPDIYPDPWLTDSSVSASSWSYASDLDYYSADRLIDDLVDIVSKNGCLLLNIAPAPDGTIPDKQKQRLRAIGAWLKVNGEAIYASRPWKVFGEGPTQTLQGHLADLKFDGFTAEDIRFTQSKDGATLYAITLGWPESGEVLMRSLGTSAGWVEDVQVLGYWGVLEWEQTAEGLAVSLPQRLAGQPAVTLKITGELLQTR